MLEVVTDDLLLRSFLLFRETARNARRALDSFDLSECFGALSVEIRKLQRAVAWKA